MDPAGDGTWCFWWTLIGVAAAGLAIRLVVVGFASRALLFGDGSERGRGAHHRRWPRVPVAGSFLAWSAPRHRRAPPALPCDPGPRHVVRARFGRRLPGDLRVPGYRGRGRGGVPPGPSCLGANVGVIAAAALAAVAPNLWQYDALVLSESMLVLSLALFLLAVYRFRERPDVPRALLMGGAVRARRLYPDRAGVARARDRGADGAARPGAAMAGFRRARLVAVAGLAGVASIAPWTVRNMTTFRQPVYFSNNLDSVIAGADL